MIRTKLLTAAMLFALMAPFVVACAPEEAEAPAAEATAEGEAPAADAGACTDAIGCLEVAAGDKLKIAYMLVTGGSDKALGEDSRNGIELAIADMPQIAGHDVELTGEDSGCSAEGGQAAATKLAADTSLVAVIGSSCSSEARAGAPIISDAGLAMVSPSNTAPDLTDPAKHVAGYLRTAHNDEIQGKVAAEYVANELKLTKVATIHDGSPYAEGLVKVFTKNFTEMGGMVVAAEAIGPDDTDFRPVLTQIAAAGPEMLYMPIFAKAGGLIVTQAQDVEGLGSTLKLMGADGLFNPDFIKAAGKSGVGMYLSSPDFSAFGSAYKDTFVPAYEAKFGTKPISSFHAHAYDAYNMIAAAIETVAVKNADGSLSIGRQALRDALFATNGLMGLTGNLTCNANGDCADPKIAVYQLTEDNLTNGEIPTDKIWPMGDDAMDAAAPADAPADAAPADATAGTGTPASTTP